jgi:hypothetical protein
MRNDIVRILLGACAGASLTWFAVLAFQHDGGSQPARAADTKPGAASVTRPSLQPASERRPSIIPANAHTAAPAFSPNRPPASPQPGDQEVVARPSSHRNLALTTGTLDPSPSSRSPQLNALLNSISIRCDFDAAGGGNWSTGKATAHGVSYQGGPIVYQSVDLDSGNAQMTGSTGATGSLTDTERRSTTNQPSSTVLATRACPTTPDTREQRSEARFRS